jgi:hypothetical protein
MELVDPLLEQVELLVVSLMPLDDLIVQGINLLVNVFQFHEFLLFDVALHREGISKLFKHGERILNLRANH